ncbi:MAG TPA: hypothetical protein PKA82_18035, partial [Pyrinomonadaceae bacterium]|nr:hypothetical protein [Pyrinomonadaceae bacterium]
MTRKLVKPIVDTMPADLLTPLAVYLKLSAGKRDSFLLESVEGGKSLARYSFIGASSRRIIEGEVIGELRQHFAEHIADTDSELPPFIGGAIGYIGFDACEWFEPTLASDRPKDAAMMFYDTIVAFDHAKQQIKIVSLDFEGEIQNGSERNRQVRGCLESESLSVPKANHPLSQVILTSNWDREDFEAAVDEIKELIAAGEC